MTKQPLISIICMENPAGVLINIICGHVFFEQKGRCHVTSCKLTLSLNYSWAVHEELATMCFFNPQHVFTHGICRVGSGKNYCPTCMSKTVLYKKFILDGHIGWGYTNVHGVTLIWPLTLPLFHFRK